MKAKRAVARGTANNGGTATAGLVIGWIVTIGYLGLFLLLLFAVSRTGWDVFWQDFEWEMRNYEGAGFLQAVSV